MSLNGKDRGIDVMSAPVQVESLLPLGILSSPNIMMSLLLVKLTLIQSLTKIRLHQ